MKFTGLILAAEEEGGHETINPLLPALPDLIWGSIVFVLLLVFVIFYVLPRVNRALDARAEAIQGGIERAEAAQAEAAEAKKQAQLALESVRAEAAEARETARKDAEAYRAELRAQAEAEAAQRLTQAEAQIAAERQAAQASLKAEVGTLALDLASGVIGESLADDKKASALVDRFLAELETSGTK